MAWINDLWLMPCPSIGPKWYLFCKTEFVYLFLCDVNVNNKIQLRWFVCLTYLLVQKNCTCTILFHDLAHSFNAINQMGQLSSTARGHIKNLLTTSSKERNSTNATSRARPSTWHIPQGWKNEKGPIKLKLDIRSGRGETQHHQGWAKKGGYLWGERVPTKRRRVKPIGKAFRPRSRSQLPTSRNRNFRGCWSGK